MVTGAGFDEGRALVTLSESLASRTAGTATDQSINLLVVIGERHPLPSHDDALQQFVRACDEGR